MIWFVILIVVIVACAYFGAKAGEESAKRSSGWYEEYWKDQIRMKREQYRPMEPPLKSNQGK